MKVLFLVTPSMTNELIIESFREVVPTSDIHIKEFSSPLKDYMPADGSVDKMLLEECSSVSPDLIIYCGPAEGPALPSIATFLKLQSKCPIINICCDGGCPNWHPILQKYKDEQCFTLIVNADGNPHWPKRDRDLTLWGPIPTRFYKPNPDKEIHFGFRGGYGDPQNRKPIVEHLVQNHGLVVGPRYEAMGKYQDYADFMMKTKIVLNMSRTGSGKTHHMKWRVIEAGMAGCCLLEQENPITEQYFSHDTHYYRWESMKQLEKILTTIRWDQIHKAAEQLHNRVMGCFTPKIFWEAIFKELAT